jgi:DNA-binding PadR family transcriptional regulator
MDITQLLALLDEGPAYGYQLKTRFEERTGGTWPLNIGQVYTTLSRLERDGLVARGGEDDAGHALYLLTDAGRAAVRHWFRTAVVRDRADRDELAIKLALAISASAMDGMR